MGRGDFYECLSVDRALQARASETGADDRAAGAAVLVSQRIQASKIIFVDPNRDHMGLCLAGATARHFVGPFPSERSRLRAAATDAPAACGFAESVRTKLAS